VVFIMKKALMLLSLFLLSLAAPLISPAQAESSESMAVLHTAVNPANNNTYHLLTASSWEDAASYAQSLGGFLVTVDDAEENQWVVETFANWDNQSRHLWIGLNDAAEEGVYRWADGTPFFYRAWGEDQPSEGGDEDYVHIAGTNMGNIDPGTWNDLDNDPQYFPVYGVVEIGPGADFALRFDGMSDHVVVNHDEGMNFENDSVLVLSAWVHPYKVTGTQFVMMKGDYGWGLYLSNDKVAFASEYSLSKHPVSNGTVLANDWSLVGVTVEVGVGYTFHINGAEAGVILDENAQVPLGDFGSNDCFSNGLACDEFYIARMGAGCDCNHFEGMLDNLSISTGTNLTSVEQRSVWMFGEGWGATTGDEQATRSGTIVGADWVMPDGSIVAQAVELIIGEEYFMEGAGAGDTLLFFAEIEEYTRTLTWFSSSWSFDEWEGEIASTFTVYVGFGFLPDKWNHNDSFSDEFGFSYQDWSWPDEGTVWFVMVLNQDLEEFYVALEADIADPPPTLDDMTELKDSIAVTNQEVSANFDSNQGYGALYYYVNVTEPLADLRIRTYGGRGDVDLGISYYSPPMPDDFWMWDDIDIGIPVDPDGQTNEGSEKLAWSTGPENDEEVHLFDVEPGLYYITAYTYRNARGFTIVADFVYPPLNIEPEDAITLTPGVEYGLLSGYNGLMQYFKVDVKQGTERLVVDLSDGGGEASLFLRYEQAPSMTTYDHHSTAQGADDRVAFNDPTPGWWYILLATESAFTGVNIVAEFADRYVWDYDGVPLELFNEDAIDGISVAEGKTVNFFAMLEAPGNYFQIETYGGNGDVQVLVEGVQYQVEWGDWGRPMPGDGMEVVTNDASIKSGSSGTQHSVFMEAPMNGRFDITLVGITDVEEISIVARWDETQLPIEPVDPTEPESVESCSEEAERTFRVLDRDGNGVLEEREIDSIDASSTSKAEIDRDGDGAVEYREYLQQRCTCNVELNTAFNAFAEGRNDVALTSLEAHDWANTFDFESVNANDNDRLERDELELLSLLCDTSFDAFDGDGDGVPDDEDAFPNDPTETKDTDGDGVGDNADIVASVSNDIVYATAGVLVLVLLGALLAFIRGGSSAQNGFDEKSWGDEDRLNQAMFGAPSAPELPATEPSMESMAGLGELAQPHDLQSAPSFIPQAPNAALMGMMVDGLETIEHPTGSGQHWVRQDPEDDWVPKSS
jgi:hypothetical protein